jgi:hypothetical protein
VTRFEEILEAGRRLSPGDIKAQILSLSRDSRFPAIVEAIRRSRETWVEQGSSDGVASDLGKQARCNGAVFALRLLMSQIQKASDDKPPAQPVRQPDEG